MTPARTFGALLLTALAGLVPTGRLVAQGGRSEVAEGNRFYDQGRFDDAHEKYLEALRENPGSPVIRFNDGNALYRSEDFQRAADAYRQTLESGDPDVSSAAWYNLGNALYREQDLERSLEAYKQALRLDPADPDAKHNLERVLELMQQQDQQDQQQQQQQGDQGDQGDQEPQDQQQQGDQGEQEQQGQQGQQGQQDQEEQQQGQDDPDPQDQPQPQAGQDQPTPSEAQDDQGEGQGEPRPGEMSPEDARRLLGALNEDPSEVDRQPPVSAQGRRPQKDW